MATISASTITVTAKPSAVNNLPYKDFTLTWENYCPLCDHNGTLTFNPKGTYEGELTCSHCGADYCAVTGKDKHGNGPRAYLTVFKDSYYYTYNPMDTHNNSNDNNINGNSTNNNNNTNNNDYLNSNMTINEENGTNTIGNLILNGINLSTYSQITAIVLENII